MPPILLDPPRPPRPAKSRYRRWTWQRQLRASGLRLLLIALLVFFGWGAWYLANKGFGRQWRTTVAEELRKRGVEASVRRLTLDPFRGLVAQDVRIYDFKNRDHPIAVISEVSLDINYAALLHRQPFLNALDIRDADVTFPNISGDPRAPVAQLKQFRAHIYFPPEQIFIRQAEGFFHGVRISATGQLIKRADYKPSRVVTEAEWRQRMELLQRVATELNQFRFPGEPPSLQIKFSGDLAEMEHAHVEATLRGELLQRGAYEMRNLVASGDWSERTLHLRQLEWSDGSGGFAGRASWNVPAGNAEFQVRSTIEAKQFLEAVGSGHFLHDATFATPPLVELSGSASFSAAEPKRSALGRVEVGGFTFRAVPFLNLTADFSWDGARTMLRNVRVRHATGDLVADLLEGPEVFRASFDSTMNPAVLRPLLPPGPQKFLGEWEWPRSPAIRLTLQGTSRAPRSWTGEGSIALPRTRFRGVWMNNATAAVQLQDGAVTFTDLRVVRPEGIGTGSFTYDFARHEVRVENVRTSLSPVEAIYWIEPKLFRVVAPYRFRSPPHLVANGVVTFRGRRETQLEIGIDAPAGMDYVFLGQVLPFDRAAGQLLITDDRVQLLGTNGTLFGGSVRGTADIHTAKPDDHYTASIALDGVDFPRLTDLYFKYKTAQGQLAGRYDFAVRNDDTRTMTGTGSMRVSNGNVFAIPVFGPLSGLISAVLPGAGYSVAKQAAATFTVADGVIHTDDFKVSGKLFGMRGHGDIHFLDDKLDFDLRIDARGAGALLTPVYQLFEYKGEGSLAKPTWRPKNF
ncbi:hypothetical protein BH20VER2_BH20VER2_07600 [soil metagenome]